MKIFQITRYLERIAPIPYQESYDNAGLITGASDWECTGVITCLDSTEAVIREAIQENCNLIIAHHPILFRGLKRLTGSNYVERTLILAIQNKIAIYAIHTNLDNVLKHGVNARIGERLGLQNTRILKPKYSGFQFSISTMGHAVEKLVLQLKGIGAKEVSSFQQASGESVIIGEMHPGILAMAQATLPEHEFTILNVDGDAVQDVGAGLIGELDQPLEALDFLNFVGKHMKTRCIRHTRLPEKPIQRVAVCGGAGGFLLDQAIAARADAFLTADYKYHEFFDADGQLLLADIGHFESEQFTIELLFEVLSSKFPNFAVRMTSITTNPVQYLYPRV